MAKKRKAKGPDDSDRIRVPFGESSKSYPGGFNPSDSDAKGAPKKRRSRDLPSLPPDADPSDDASMDGLFDSSTTDSSDMSLFDSSVTGSSDLQSVEPPRARTRGSDSLEDLVELDPDDPDAFMSVSDRIGPVNPSGPLVIVEDDENPDSNRFQASIVDDSARLAGSTSGRKKKKKKKRKTSARKRSWRQEPVESVDPDSDVPFPERRSRSRSGRGAAPAPAGSKKGVVVVTLMALLALGGLGAGLEMRRQQDLKTQRDQLANDFDTKLKEALADSRGASDKALEDAQREARDQAVKERDAAHAKALEAQKRDAAELERKALAKAQDEAAANTKKALDAQRERLERASREAIEVELARARDESDPSPSEDELKAALDDAVAAEKSRGKKSKADALKKERKRHTQEVEDLKRRFNAEREAASSVPDDDPFDFSDEPTDDGSETGGGGGGDDDWDKFFDEGGGASSGDGGDGEGEGVTLRPVEQAWAWIREKFHGHVGYKNLSHFSRGEFHDLRKTRHELRAKVEFRDWLFANEGRSRGLKLVAGVDIMEDDDGFTVRLPQSIDEDQRRRPIVAIDEAYLDVVFDWLDVRGGWQTFSWGTGDLYNPTNNLNPVDFSDLFDARRIPVLSAAITLDFSDFAFDLIAIPTFTRSRLVLANKRFDTLRNSPIPVLDPADPDEGVNQAQWAGRARASIAGWDVSISGFSGFNDLPAPRFVLEDPNDPLSIAVDPVFERTHVAGADFATTLGIFGAEGTLGEILGGIQLHGEIAHYWTEGEETDDYANFVFGFNYQFVDLIFEHDLTLVLEYAGEFITKETENELEGGQIDRSLKGAVLARLQYEVDQDLSFELNMALITEGQKNGLVHPGVTWKATDEVSLGVSGDIFFGNDETFFGQYRHDGRVIIELNLNF